MNEEQIKAYVLLARNGDSTAFCKLYEQYYKDMYRFAYYMLGNEEDAKDVISETVLDAFTGIRNLKKPERFKAWIFRILSVKCKRQMAVYTSNRKYLSPEEEGARVSGKEHPFAEHIDVKTAFHALNETERAIISLMVFGGYTSRETAELLNSREGTVRSAKSRAFQKMSQYLKEDFA